jgi:hypothetical protein
MNLFCTPNCPKCAELKAALNKLEYNYIIHNGLPPIYKAEARCAGCFDISFPYLEVDGKWYGPSRLWIEGKLCLDGVV